MIIPTSFADMAAGNDKLSSTASCCLNLHIVDSLYMLMIGLHSVQQSHNSSDPLACKRYLKVAAMRLEFKGGIVWPPVPIDNKLDRINVIIKQQIS